MAKNEFQNVKVGDQVRLVLADGKTAPAKATKVLGGGKIDLVADVNGQEVVITSSPNDPLATQADSWHALPGAEAQPKEPEKTPAK